MPEWWRYPAPLTMQERDDIGRKAMLTFSFLTIFALAYVSLPERSGATVLDSTVDAAEMKADLGGTVGFHTMKDKVGP